MNKELKLRTIIFFSIAFILVAFLGLHGTMSSGFHFVDNHEVVQINRELSDANGSLIHVISTWVKNDLGGRFRPMYMIDNVIVYTTLNGNFFLISLYHTLLIILIVFFLFLSLRKLGFPLFEALTFPIVALTGVQSAIWWRLGPNESIGMWYLSLSLLFMVYAIKNKTKNGLFRLLFCLATLLMMLCKESFLLFSPAMVLIYLSLDKHESDDKWFLILKRHLPEVSLISVFFLATIFFILTKVNTENLGYAGIKDVNPSAYLNTFGKLLSEGGIGIVSIILFIISGVLSYRWSQNKKKVLSNHILVLLITICITIPQSFLYAKSGMFERYFLPGILAWAFMLSFSLKNLKKVIEPKLLKVKIDYYLFFEIALLLSLVIPRLLIVSREATIFTTDGKEVNSVLSMITENVHKNQTIVFVADPISDFERTISFRRYLGGTNGLTKIFTYPVIPVNSDAFGKLLIHYFSQSMGGEEMHFNQVKDKKSVDMFVMFPLLRDRGDSIISSLGYNMNDFLPFKIGSYELYIRNQYDLNVSTDIYKSEVIPPIPKQETLYKEMAFFPQKSIDKEDSVEISIHPSSEIKAPMVAFIILLDKAHPENIAVHQQVFGINEIKVSKAISKDIEEPWLIYRNWGNKQAIPSATISIRVKRNTVFHIPIR